MSKYTFTETDANGLATTAHHSDRLQTQNEIRRILMDLGEALKHSSFDDGAYPENATSTVDIRGAVSLDNYTISLSAGKTVTLEYGGTAGTTLSFKVEGSEVQWSHDKATWWKMVPINVVITTTALSTDQVLKYSTATATWTNQA